MLSDIVKQKNISKYRLSKRSGIPYTTLSDILSGKTDLRKCSAETVYKLSVELKVSMEDILAPYFTQRSPFELFKSNVCHRLKELGDIDFIIATLEEDNIQKYYDYKWYPESFYLLAMLDYISRLNNVPLCNKYDNLRRQSLSEIIYPSSVIAIAAAVKSDLIKIEAEKNSIPEFLRFNIVESEVRNVI